LIVVAVAGGKATFVSILFGGHRLRRAPPWDVSIEELEHHIMVWAIFPGDEHERAVLELVTGGSERVMAIVGGALLERAVDRTLRERLFDVPELVNSLLSINGPLSNMGPKIDLLRLLGAFDERTHEAMKAIARVRNFFAHDLDASLESADGKFTKPMQRLTLHENRTHYPHHLFGPDSNVAIEPINSKREQFIVNLKLALIILMRDRISHHTYTNRPRSAAELLELYPNRYSAEEQPPA
jgi:DNA-binding MltR family transcriptional regulator